MSRIIRDPFTYHFPHLDIHGETTKTCIAPIKSFITENVKLQNKTIIIIHGKGSGALKKATHQFLKNHRQVNKYFLDGMNDGQTIIELNLEK